MLSFVVAAQIMTPPHTHTHAEQLEMFIIENYLLNSDKTRNQL